METMASTTGLRIQLLLLSLTFSSPSLQTPATHVVTKTITAADLGPALSPSLADNANNANNAVNPIIKINVPTVSLAPSSTITITTIFTIDDPNSGTLFGIKVAHVAMLLILLFCSLAVVAYQNGYSPPFFKKPIEAAASKAKPPVNNPPVPSDKTKHPTPTPTPTKPPGQSPQPKPTERPRSTSQPQSKSQYIPPTEEELNQMIKAHKEREDALRHERDTYHWESLFASDDHMRLLERHSPYIAPESPSRGARNAQNTAAGPASAMKKKRVTFAEPVDSEVRSGNNRSNHESGSRRPKVAVNII